MSSESKNHKTLRYSGTVIFALLGLGALFGFVIHFISLLSQFFASPELLEFNLGAMRLLGVGIGILALTYLMVTELYTGTAPGNRVTRIMVRTIFVGIILCFLLPHVLHFPLEKHLFNKGYKICEPLSHRWLASRVVVYANSVEACLMPVETNKG